MKRLLASLVALGLLSCSAVSAIRNGDSLGAADSLVSDGADAMAAKKEIDRRCDPLGEGDLSLNEERSMGGTVAIASAIHLGGLRIAPTAASDKAALADPGTLRYDADAPFNQMTAEVAKLGAKLAVRSSRPGLAWTFAVVESPSVNAFSAPGGYVFVTRGLLNKVTTEDALAGVLAHEITHVTHRDAAKAYLKEKVRGCKTILAAEKLSGAAKDAALSVLSKYGVPSGAAGPLIDRVISGSNHDVDYDKLDNHPLLKLFAGMVLDHLEAGYAREQELAADAGAVELMANAGFNPKAFIALVGSLQSTSDTSFAHHPEPSERTTAMDEALAALHEDHPFIDWKKIDARKDVRLAAAIRRGAADGAVASDPKP